jgi:hypothetical protein
VSMPLRSPSAARPAYQIHHLVSGMSEVAARLPSCIAGLSDLDRQFLYDVARGRHKFAALERLLRLAARSERINVRMDIAELVRAALRRPLMPATAVTLRDVIRSSDVETAAQGPADIAIRQFEQHPNAGTRAGAVAAIIAHLEADRDLLDQIEAITL